MSWFKTPSQLALEEDISIKIARKNELKKLLDSTDHKVLSDYEKKENEDLDSIIVSRTKWREEIREILASLHDYDTINS